MKPEVIETVMHELLEEEKLSNIKIEELSGQLNAPFHSGYGFQKICGFSEVKCAVH